MKIRKLIERAGERSQKRFEKWRLWVGRGASGKSKRMTKKDLERKANWKQTTDGES